MWHDGLAHSGVVMIITRFPQRASIYSPKQPQFSNLHLAAKKT
jgi:hypothetical protein